MSVADIPALISKGAYREAAHLLYAETKLDPSRSSIWHNLAAVNGLQKNAAAYNFARRALLLSPESAKSWRLLVKIGLAGQINPGTPAAARRTAILNPSSTNDLLNLAAVFSRTGNTPETLSAFRALQRQDPENAIAAHMIAALTGQDRAAAPAAYISHLFDAYAEQFSEHLEQTLLYKIPETAREQLERLWPNRRFRRALDIGCGDGHAARCFGPLCDVIDGIDLSERMLEKAAATGFYQTLIPGDFNNPGDLSLSDDYDLLLAMDVCPYIGDLTGFFETAAAGAKRPMLLILSCENYSGKGFHLQTTGRFCHSASYVAATAQERGFKIRSTIATPIRRHKDGHQPGFIMTLSA